MTTRPTFEARPTIPSDIEELGVELPFRIRAMTAVIDGKVAGIGGVGFMPNGAVVAFLHATDEVRAHRVALHRGARRFFQDMRRLVRRPITAVADQDIEAAERWLARLGFTPSPEHETVWLWQN